MKAWMIAGIVLSLSSVALAGEESQPVLSHDMVWAGVLVQIVVGLFIAALTIGPLVAILMPDRIEPPLKHEEHDPHGH